MLVQPYTQNHHRNIIETSSKHGKSVKIKHGNIIELLEVSDLRLLRGPGRRPWWWSTSPQKLGVVMGCHHGINVGKSLWYSMVSHDILWISMVFHGILRYSTIFFYFFFGSLCHSILWLCETLCVLLECVFSSNRIRNRTMEDHHVKLEHHLEVDHFP